MIMIREMGSLIGHYKMKRTLLLMIIGILISSFFSVSVENVSADSTSYYVANDGNDSNSGTSISSPWKTIGKVNSELNGGVINAGDDIYFNRGDTFTDTYLNIGLSGESTSNPTVIGAYGTGDLPEIYNTGSYGIFINNKHYITIENLKIRQAAIWIRIQETCSYINVQNCIMRDSGGAWGGIYVTNHAQHIKILNNNLYNSFGDIIMLYYDVDYSLVEGNIIEGGPVHDHTAIVIRGLGGTKSSYNIVRNNNIYNGADQLIALSQEVEHTLVENNVIDGTDGGPSSAGIKLCGTWNNIIRKNIVHDTTAYGTGIYTNLHGGYTSHGEDNVFYHNTVYNCGDDGADGCNKEIIFAGGGVLQNNIFKNNIYFKGNPQVVYADAVNPYDPLLTNNLWDNNIIYHTTGVNLIKYKGAYYDVAGAESTFPTKFQNNIQADPKLSGFNLQSDSPAIDSGDWLTTTNGGGTGTTITVHDAKYFCDGFGLIDGDTIMVDTDEVTITNVNYGTNQITVDASITWIDGDPVSLTYNGNAPDIGAYEFVSSGPDTTPPQISNVILTESNPLDTDPSFGWIYITATITDNIEVDNVLINISCPNGSSYSFSMNSAGSTYYYNTNTVFSNHGNFIYSIWANDINGNPTTTSSYDFSMPPNWDLNNDGQCNLFDLTLISNHYGETGPNGWIREDVNNNGIIQVLDLILITGHYNEEW